MANITIVATGGTRAPTQIELAARFLRDGHKVRFIATHNALRFLFSYLIRRPWKILPYLWRYRPQLLETLAYFKHKPKSVPHVSEGKWADVMVMAPATCNSIGKLVGGISDNYPLLSIRALPRSKKVVVVPSMNPEMWFDPHLQRNVDLLNATEKYRVLCPSRGQMLSGDWGFGAQVPLEEIVTETYRALGLVDEEVEDFLSGRKPALPWEEATAAREPGDAVELVLIDEDDALREELARGIHLAYRDFQVRQFRTASEALPWLHKRPPSLVFTEMSFSHGLQGHELVKQLRQHPGAAQVHLIASSKLGRREVGAEQLARQEVLYVPKPMNIGFAVGMIGGCVRTERRKRQTLALRRLEAGEILFREGEWGSSIYVVQSGKLRVTQKQNRSSVVLSTVGERGMVGELAFFTRSPRSATVQAMTDAEVVELEMDHVTAAMENQPVWLRQMIDSLLEHLRQTSTRLIELENAGEKKVLRRCGLGAALRA
jgi:DNA-binding response OmpR family regulator